jgi:subtilase family serine protease
MAVGPALAGAATPAGRAMLQSSSPAALPASKVRATPATASVEFDVGLRLSNPAGAVAFEQAVSNPASASYRHYLTPAQWERRYSPTASSAAAVTSWLQSEGITVESASPDRMTISATAPAATIERAFGTSLGEYRQGGRVVRLASGQMTVPSAVASLITGVTGVDQNVATPDDLTDSGVPASRRSAAKPAATPASAPIPQPPGFRNAPPCSAYWAQKHDKTDPEYGGGFPSPLPYALCGYVPAQFQGAYGLTPAIEAGDDGQGVTVAIVDAYVSPTLLSDAQEYSLKNQPSEVLSNSQFSEIVSKSFNEEELCEASGWSGEQTLDVEAVHATAPGANILYMGAKNCLTGLYKSVQQVVDGHLAQVITDSWGDDGGDLLDSAGSREGFDDILLMAGATGVGVQFSAGDGGDEFTTLGITAADYPPSSPYATAVGGTSLEVSKNDTRKAELGWSTAKSILCTPLLEEAGLPGCESSTQETWLPPAPGAYDYGGGGGTSYEYAEPWYQEGVVPEVLAERNTAITGIANRVEPDISMDADPTTGMLVGETQEFPNGTYYDQYRIGGTSLSSPLFAGVMADADQAAGTALGFVNPLLYKLAASPASAASAFYDIVPRHKTALARVDYLNDVGPEEGTLTSVRVLNYEGPEEFCSGTGDCTTQNVALNVGRRFDSMTGIGSPGSGLLAALANP